MLGEIKELLTAVTLVRAIEEARTEPWEAVTAKYPPPPSPCKMEFPAAKMSQATRLTFTTATVAVCAAKMPPAGTDVKSGLENKTQHMVHNYEVQ